MEFFLKYKVIILRLFGLGMFIVSVFVHFSNTPKDMSENERAVANIARMQRTVSVSLKANTKSSGSSVSKQMSEFQEKQKEIFSIFLMVSSMLFFGFSFIKKDVK